MRLGLWDTARTAWRGLRSAPRTSSLALLILSVGITSATVTFSVVDAVVLRALPFDEPNRLIAISMLDGATARSGPVAPQDFFTWQDQVSAFEGLAFTSGGGALMLNVDGTPTRLVAHRVSTNLFDVLRVRPLLGFGFSLNHQQVGHDKVVVLSYEFWQRQFGGNREVIGRMVNFGTTANDPRQVIGVMPPGFTHPIGPARATEAWIPYLVRPSDRDHGVGGRGYSLYPVGRLKPDASIENARGQVEAATASVVAAYPAHTYWKDARPLVEPLNDAVVGSAKSWLVLLLGAVSLVLLIAYVNVANLLLVRASTRSREFAVRSALGASRARVAKVLLAEGLMLSLGAAALGVLGAQLGLAAVVDLLPAGLARASTIALDVRVLSVAVAAAILTGLASGVVPAWEAGRLDVISALKHGGGAIGAGGVRQRWQRRLLIVELAFVVTLLVTAAMFVGSFVNVLRADLGFDRARLVGFSVSRTIPNGSWEQRWTTAHLAVEEALTRVRALPGVQDAAWLDGGLPLFGNVAAYSITVDGFGETKGADMVAIREVTPNYFDVAGIRFLSGAPFEMTRLGGPPAVILNDEAVKRFFGGRDPVGEFITFRERTRVVGVVNSVRIAGPEGTVRPEMYLPLWQHDVKGGSVYGDVVVRLRSSAATAVAEVGTVLAPFTRTGQPPPPRDVDEQFRLRTAGRRFNAGLMAAFGVLALLMAGVGVYGVLSFTVASEARTIGVRMAVGATAGRVFAEVMASTGRVLAWGVGIGLAAGWAVSRTLRTVVFGLTGGEAWLYGVVALVVVVVGAIATLLPARRAAHVDPLVVLRGD